MNLQFEERPSLHGYRIGIASLDAEKSLNALSLPMIEALDERLKAWAEDPTIACVMLRGNGPKAFCAGGDVVQLVHQCREHPGEVPPLARRFFADEYRLDYRIHTFPKPFICWAHGHVLGGGMGLMQGAGIRIVTPSSRLGMPEINIGLYPDVGGSWFLARLPGRLGLFLGLTAASINARDALDLNLADRFLRDDQQQALLEGLVQLNWREQAQLQLHSLLQALENEARGDLPLLSAYYENLKNNYLPRDAEVNYAHAARQAYIALGVALVAAAEQEVDSTPMEGFDPAKVDEILGLKERGLRSVILLPLGYRDAESDWLAPMKKVRKSAETLVTHID